jgi:hypothetical protein
MSNVLSEEKKGAVTAQALLTAKRERRRADKNRNWDRSGSHEERSVDSSSNIGRTRRAARK